jgi:hypothetical protein
MCCSALAVLATGVTGREVLIALPALNHQLVEVLSEGIDSAAAEQAALVVMNLAISEHAKVHPRPAHGTISPPLAAVTCRPWQHVTNLATSCKAISDRSPFTQHPLSAARLQPAY